MASSAASRCSWSWRVSRKPVPRGQLGAERAQRHHVGDGGVGQRARDRGAHLLLLGAVARRGEVEGHEDVGGVRAAQRLRERGPVGDVGDVRLGAVRGRVGEAAGVAPDGPHRLPALAQAAHDASAGVPAGPQDSDHDGVSSVLGDPVRPTLGPVAPDEPSPWRRFSCSIVRSRGRSALRCRRLGTVTVAAHPPWTPSDAVGAALHVLRMSGTFYCSSDLRGPWGLRLPETPGCLWFHVVTSGTATIVVGDEVVTLSASDVVLLPRGEGHELRSTDPPPRSPAPNVLTLPHTWYGERYATIHLRRRRRADHHDLRRRPPRAPDGRAARGADAGHRPRAGLAADRAPARHAAG